ncbi:MAG: hypothetical protein GC159_11585 [Phycisphaera sp.]|nr:hypothetical protein [Phycisphaera sp.]
MSDHLKKVQSGDPLVIPAATFNAFVDAAFDFSRRQRGLGRDSQAVFRQLDIIPVRNDTGEDLDRFSAVGIAAPIIGPDVNADEFKNRATAIGVKPIVPDHRGRFAVYLEPVKDGKIAPACVSGVIPCQINVEEETHLRADIEHDETILLTGHHGGAEILWKESGKGVKWALVKVGIAEPLAITFDVKLVKADGESGENCEEDCSFKYDIFDIHTGEKLNEDDEPQGPIQSDIRPKKTQMIAATRGTAYWTVKEVDGKPKIAVQLEEAFEEPTPRAQQYVVTGISCDEGSGSASGDGGGGTLGHGSGDCCDFTLKYHTSKVCYPPGVKLEDGPTYTVRCGSSSSGSSSGSSFESSDGSPSGSGSSSGSPSSSGSSGSSSSSPPSSSSGSSQGSSSPSSGSPPSGSSGPPELPPPPSEPGYYQLCVCYDGTVHWTRTGDTSCGSSDSSGSTPPPPPPPPPSGSSGVDSSSGSDSSSSGSASGSSDSSSDSSGSESSSSSSVPDSSDSSGSNGSSASGSPSGSSSPSSATPSSGASGSTSSDGGDGSASSGSDGSTASDGSTSSGSPSGGESSGDSNTSSESGSPSPPSSAPSGSSSQGGDGSTTSSASGQSGSASSGSTSSS